MNIITKIEDWGNSHRPGSLDVFRIITGVFLTYKGGMFAQNIEQLEMSIAGTNMHFLGVAVAHYVIFAHLLGGPLLAAGLFTRVMSFIQIPILLGAVLLVNAPQGFMSVGNHMELEISFLVLGGLVAFMIFGAGKFSVDEKRRQEKAAGHLVN